RLVDMGILPFLIISTVKSIIAQRLVRKLLPSKEKYFLNQDEIKNLGKIIDLDRMLKLLQAEKIVGEGQTWDKVPFYKAVKSSDTDDGYSGRVGIHEVLKVTSTIREIITRGGS